MSPKLPQVVITQLRKRMTPRLPSRYHLPRPVARLLPFLQDKIPERYQPDSLKHKGLDRLGQPLLDANNADEAHFVPSVPTAPPPLAQPEFRYRQFTCPTGNPLQCAMPAQTLMGNPQAQGCATCGFPTPLAADAEIMGRRGRYQIRQHLGQRGWGRLYSALQPSEDQAVLIKEYVLPHQSFSADEIRLRQATFTRLAGLTLADGRVQDFRCVVPWDAIADAHSDRCYAVFPRLQASQSLRDTLEQAAIPPHDIRQLLAQVLQSLEFLHTQKFRLPSGQVQTNVVHGNLTLDSLLLTRKEGQLLVYLCDLALWEFLFKPSLSTQATTVADDLAALGQIARQLLDRWRYEARPWAGTAAASAASQDWAAVDPALTKVVQRLAGTHRPFESAAQARQTIHQLPPLPLPRSPQVALKSADAPRASSRLSSALPYLLGGSLLLLLASVLWYFARPSDPAVADSRVLNCCIDDVSAVPAGQARYGGVSRSTWSYVLQQVLTGDGHNLETVLEQQQPKLDLVYQPDPTVEGVGQALQDNKTAFAIAAAPQGDNTLATQPIAYDGLAVFVAFSYVGRSDGLPEALQGKITLAQLQQLYTGQITNWRDFGGPDLTVSLYIPDEPETVRIFEERVLQTPQHIAQFRRLQAQTGGFTAPLITQLPTFDALRAVIRDFEDRQVGAIAFGTISQTFGQCAVYPLAVGGSREKAVQPLVQDSGEPITPATDLCGDKGSYSPQVSDFQTQRYPLAYSLKVIYPRDNSRPPFGRKVAELLTTQAGQRRLRQTGLIPLQPLPRQE